MNSTFDPLVGQVLEERYEIVAKVARGGMATVYRAHSLSPPLGQRQCQIDFKGVLYMQQDHQTQPSPMQDPQHMAAAMMQAPPIKVRADRLS